MNLEDSNIDNEAEFGIYKEESDGSDQFGDITEELNFWHSCRICGDVKDDMVSIYDQTGIELQLEEKINNYLPITVAADDDFPVFVCSDCVDKLNTTHELVVMCIESNNKFNDYLKSREEKTKADKSVRRDVVESESKMYETEGMVEDSQESQKKANNSENMKEDNKTPDMSMLKFLEKDGGSSCGIHKNGSLQGELHQEPEYVLSYEDNFPSFQFSNADMIKEVDNEVLNSMENMTTLVPVPLHNTFSDMQSFDCKSSHLNTMEKVVSLKLHEDGFVHCEDDFTSFQDFTKTKLPKPNESAFRHQDVSNLKAPDQCEVDSHGAGLNCPVCSYTAQSQDELDSHVACCNISSSVAETQGHDTAEHCKLYTKVETHQVHRLGHMISHGFDSAVSWNCTSCHLNFQSSERLHEHRETCHATLWLCDLCGQGFSTSEELSDHHNLMHVQGLQRNSRPNVFRNRFLLRKHLSEHQKASNTGTEYDLIQDIDLADNLEEVDISSSVTPYECGICGEGFARKGSLTKHYKTHAGDNTVTCRTCHATFPSVAGLLNHRKTHAPPGSSSDWEMSPVATSSVTSTAPVSNFAAGLPLLTTTPISSPSTTNLNTSGSESFRCPRCDKLLSSKLSLALHTRVHTGEKPFECGVCHKRFTQKPALTYHMRLHTGERPHICRFCGKGFNSKVGKESHERIHTGERPYRCGQCGVGFRCSANLRQHTWIHTDSRPFTCNICHKPFRRREALQVHTRTHTGERPYQCPRCGRRFTQKGDMLKHARSHDRPGGGRAPAAPAATCGTCGQTFAQRKHLKAHRCLLASKPADSPADIIAIDADDIITFPEITVVTNDTQDFDVGYVS